MLGSAHCGAFDSRLDGAVESTLVHDGDPGILTNAYFLFLKMIVILMDVKWCLIVVSICVSLMGIEHLFMCVATVYLFWKNICEPSAHFLNWIVCH